MRNDKQIAESVRRRIHGIAEYECADCGRRFEWNDLMVVKRYFERVHPDGPEPDGECPECGALCYEVTAD